MDNKDYKEMVYGGERGVLASGDVDGFKWLVLSLGRHPCAYVKIPVGHKYHNKLYQDIDINDKVHGCLTYSEDEVAMNPFDKSDDDWFIGWDYAHLGDYSGHSLGSAFNDDAKKWTTTEMVREVMGFIELLKGDN